MRLSSKAVRLRASSIALALALTFALAGLYAVDRALSASNRVQVQVEAAESAALVQGFLAVHTEALQSIRGLYLDTTRVVRGDHFQSLVSSMTQYANSFRRIWITDTAGRVWEQHQFGPKTPPFALPIGLDVDTIHVMDIGHLAARARLSRRAQITRPGQLATGERGVLLMEPIFVADRFRGFAGGTITTNAIVSSVLEGRPRVRGHLVILLGADTVAATEQVLGITSRVDSASAAVELPDGGEWRVVVLRRSSYANIRPLLWGIGLATLGALIVMLLHERRQGLRLAERSAELERLSAELLRANRAKSEFLANVSHELRTPLNAIVGFVELLRDGVYGELGMRQVSPVDRIASSANHLRQLVDQILDLAKMAAGRMEVHPESIDLRAFVLTVASEVEPLITERGLNFSIDLKPTLPRVRTDTMHLRQILMNLLGNATKFTPTGEIAIRAHYESPPSHSPVPHPWISSIAAPLSLQASPSSTSSATASTRAPRAAPPFSGASLTRGWIALQVADTGIGIKAGDKERIFEEFEQVNAGPRGDSMQRGTGLGLAISRRLVRLLGGEITVESQQGKGSIFTIWLPADGDATPRLTPSDAAEPCAVPETEP